MKKCLFLIFSILISTQAFADVEITVSKVYENQSVEEATVNFKSEGAREQACLKASRYPKMPSAVIDLNSVKCEPVQESAKCTAKIFLTDHAFEYIRENSAKYRDAGC